MGSWFYLLLRTLSLSTNHSTHNHDKRSDYQNIISLKGHSSINYGKKKIEDFTEKLFYTLFDANAPLSESIDELRVLFKEISIM
jgi:serine O-acetyltransferase